MAISFAKGGANCIAIGARSGLSDVSQAIKQAAKDAERQEPVVLSLRLDVTDQKSVEEAAKQIEKEFGKLDIVINNAGILGNAGPIADSDPEDWWSVFTVNLRGPYLISRSCIPLLLKGDVKTLISVTSVGAHCAMPGFSHYMPSKLAVTRVTQIAALEYQDKELVAYSVHPGNVLTDIVGMGEGMEETFKAVFTETTELCGDGLVFLTSEKRDWLSGRYINMCWDLPELISSPKKDEIIKEDKLKVTLRI